MLGVVHESEGGVMLGVVHESEGARQVHHKQSNTNLYVHCKPGRHHHSHILGHRLSRVVF